MEKEYSVVTFSTPPDTFKKLYREMPLSPVKCERGSFSNRKGVFVMWTRLENGKYTEKWGFNAKLSAHPFTLKTVERVVKCCFPEGTTEKLCITMYFFRHEEPVGALQLHQDGAAYVSTFPIDFQGFDGGDGHIQTSDGTDVIVSFSKPGIGYIANDVKCKHGATALTTNSSKPPIRDVFIITVAKDNE